MPRWRNAAGAPANSQARIDAIEVTHHAGETLRSADAVQPGDRRPWVPAIHSASAAAKVSHRASPVKGGGALIIEARSPGAASATRRASDAAYRMGQVVSSRSGWSASHVPHARTDSVGSCSTTGVRRASPPATRSARDMGPIVYAHRHDSPATTRPVTSPRARYGP